MALVIIFIVILVVGALKSIPDMSVNRSEDYLKEYDFTKKLLDSGAISAQELLNLLENDLSGAYQACKDRGAKSKFKC